MELLGKPIAEKIYEEIREKLGRLKSKPGLAAVLVGEDPASLSYVRLKEKKAKELGIEFFLYHLPAISSERQVLDLVEEVNRDEKIDGVIIQLPLPGEIETEKIINAIEPAKDIDGFSHRYSPPTAQAILEIFDFYDIDYQKMKIAIVGQGRLVGGPLAKILKSENIEPIICDSSTIDLQREISKAEIIISATGVPGLISPEMVNSNMILIDAGTAESAGKMVGDVDPACYGIAKSYSPVPGGVGPVTLACLMRNLVFAVTK